MYRARSHRLQSKGSGWLIRLHEKGAKQHMMPCHHAFAFIVINRPATAEQMITGRRFRIVATTPAAAFATSSRPATKSRPPRDVRRSRFDS
jgi:hypothetical protein